MSDITIEKAILEEVHHLATDHQKKVLDYARSLSKTVLKGVPGKDLLHFAGTIDKDDLKKISQAIDEGCESINADERTSHSRE